MVAFHHVILPLQVHPEQIFEQFKAAPEEAAKLIDVGEKPAEKSLPAPELAAWTVIASQILNLDETLTK